MAEWEAPMSKLSKKVMDLDDGLYRISCDCIDEDCDLTIWFDYDKEFNIIELNMYKKHYIHEENILNNIFIKILKQIKYRISMIIKILFTGKIEIYDGIILRDPEHIQNFIDALNESKKLVEKENKNV